MSRLRRNKCIDHPLQPIDSLGVDCTSGPLRCESERYTGPEGVLYRRGATNLKTGLSSHKVLVTESSLRRDEKYQVGTLSISWWRYHKITNVSSVVESLSSPPFAPRWRTTPVPFQNFIIYPPIHMTTVVEIFYVRWCESLHFISGNTPVPFGVLSLSLYLEGPVRMYVWRCLVVLDDQK